MDQDVILVRVKSSVKTTVFLYKLCSQDEVDEAGEGSDGVEEDQGGGGGRRNRTRRRQRAEDPRELRRSTTWNERYNWETKEEEEEDPRRAPLTRQKSDNSHGTRSRRL